MGREKWANSLIWEGGSLVDGGRFVVEGDQKRQRR
jgi:hypothetical protein